MLKKTKYALVLAAICGMALAGTRAWTTCRTRQSADLPMQEGKSVEQRVHSLLSIGMTESEVVRLLTDAGIQFGETIKPTASGDYFTIHVPLRTSRGILETAEYVVTGSGRFTGSKAYVVVTLDADSIVTAIE